MGSGQSKAPSNKDTSNTNNNTNNNNEDGMKVNTSTDSPINVTRDLSPTELKVEKSDADEWYSTLDKQYKTAYKQTLKKKKERERVNVENAANAIRSINAFGPMANIIFVMGGPGSGKGTQCKRIVSEFNFCHLSVGALFRKEVEKGSEIGNKVQSYMQEGKIVPVEITLGVIQAAMKEAENKTSGFLLDGFPRELDQLLEFEKTVTTCKFALFFDTTDDVLLQRCLNRPDNRPDDNEETIKKRLETFHSQTIPAIEHLEKASKLKKFDANGNPDEIFEQVKKVFIEAGIHKELWKEEVEKAFIEKVASLVKGEVPPAGEADTFTIPRSTKKGLLIGIDYKDVDFKKNLTSSVNDVNIFSKILQTKFEFETLVLTDASGQKPTRTNILAALNAIVSSCTAGDVLCLYFNGHAMRVSDGNKVEEALIATDGAVLGAEISNVLKGLKPGVKLTVILDSCYSGDDSLDTLPQWSASGNGVFLACASKGQKFIETENGFSGIFLQTLNKLLEAKSYSVDYSSLVEYLDETLKSFSHVSITEVNDPEETFFLEKAPTKLPAN